MAKIVVAEDDKDVREMLTQLLQFGGHEVEAVSSAPEALARLQIDKPDLLITDFLMPGGGAEELLRVLDAQADLETEQVLILTGLADHDWRVQAAHEQGFAVEQKPIRAKSFLERVSQLLAKSA